MFPGSCYSWQPQPLSQGHRSQALHSYRGMKGENNWRNCFFFFFFSGEPRMPSSLLLFAISQEPLLQCVATRLHTRGLPCPLCFAPSRTLLGSPLSYTCPQQPSSNLCLLSSESPVLPELPHSLSASPILHRNRISLKAPKLGAFPSTCFQKV